MENWGHLLTQLRQTTIGWLLHGSERELFCEMPGRTCRAADFFALCAPGEKRNIFS